MLFSFKNDSSVTFHANATEGKELHLLFADKTDDPSHLLDAVNKYLSLNA